uniref:Sushi domain containing 1 n=1 Tax=Neolamprologus brichardi TaxID=32507 RepID=A0A3Q4ML05_NEOBR
MIIGVLSILSGKPAEGQSLLDVCSTCHANATCDDKSDGSGKVCNCKYGFVGNGRTFCQDKDECQIGSTKICGQHTTCHNTFGSYYCTCLAGYSPSNNMAVFIPNDGTHCQDIDECGITGQCGEGAQCRNLEGSFDCSCQVGYKIHNGVEPFNPLRDKASCKEILCGNPPVIEFTGQVWSYNSTPGSTVLYFCKDGFYNKGGNNVSTCQENGQWTSPTLSCQEILCGNPPNLPHTGQVWKGSSTPGSTVIYYCKKEFYHSDGNNVSVCTINGYWTKPDISCKGNSFLLALSRHKQLFIFFSEKYEEDTEVYKQPGLFSMTHLRSFYDKRKRFLSSKADQLKLCLGLLPVTNYSITVTATSARFTASVTTNTSLPVVYYREFDTPLPTLSLRRSPNTLDLISLYQVFVLPVEGFMMFNCSSPAIAPPLSTLKSPAEYIAAQFEVHRVGTEMNLTIGDGLLYGGFYNAPLESGKNYYIILRAVSQWKSVSAAILWLKSND